MNAGEIIGISIVILFVIVLLGLVFIDMHKQNKAKAKKLAFRNAIKPGSAFVFYGENGGGDPFAAEEHYIMVIDEKSGWVKLREEIYSADRSKKPYTTTSSYKKENFVNWILLHKDVQFYENINK